MDPPEGEEGELASEEEDPDLHQGDPNLSQLVLNRRASTSSQSKKGKTLLWNISQENTKFYAQAQQANHQSDLTYASQSHLKAKTQACYGSLFVTD